MRQSVTDMHSGRSTSHTRPPRRLQFSLRSLLLLVTFSCIGLSLLPYLDFPLWALPVLAVLAWSGLLTAQGAAALAAAAGYRRRGPEDDFWLHVGRRRAVLFAAVAAAAPGITFLLSLVALGCAGLDVHEMGRYADRLAGSAGFGWQGVCFAAWLGLLLANPASGLLNVASFALYFRPRRDFPFLLVRVFGLLNSLVATGITLALWPGA